MDLENTPKDWMEKAPLLAATGRKNPFKVPQNYFNGLEENIQSRVALEDLRFDNEDEFSVPAGYFESLPLQIEGRIAGRNIRDLVPSDGFTVPEGYFSKLEESILTKAFGQKSHKTSIRPIRPSWLKYAAAACITLILGSVLIFNNQNSSIESRLGKIPEQEIISYLEIHSDMGDTPLIMESLREINLSAVGSDVSEADIEEYINTTL